jgi:Family of unknown function (DUF6328)
MADRRGSARTHAHRAAQSTERSETPTERADRNFNELLQELRVAQTGVQILFAFVLTLGFQSRFAEIDQFQLVVYVCCLLLCAGATAMLIGPVAVHRRLFRRGRKPELVNVSSQLAQVGLLMLLLAVVCSLLFVLDVILARSLALVLTGGVTVVFVVVWYLLPSVVDRRSRRD